MAVSVLAGSGVGRTGSWTFPLNGRYRDLVVAFIRVTRIETVEVASCRKFADTTRLPCMRSCRRRFGIPSSKLESGNHPRRCPELRRQHRDDIAYRNRINRRTLHAEQDASEVIDIVPDSSDDRSFGKFQNLPKQIAGDAKDACMSSLNHCMIPERIDCLIAHSQTVEPHDGYFSFPA